MKGLSELGVVSKKSKVNKKKSDSFMGMGLDLGAMKKNVNNKNKDKSTTTNKIIMSIIPIFVFVNLDEKGLAVEIIYIESADHSNANLLKSDNVPKKYLGIARALFAYAAKVSMDAGFGGVLYFRAKTTELRAYYMKEFGAVPLGQYDPMRMIIWEDAANEIISQYEEVDQNG